MAVKFSQFLAESLTSPSFLVGYNSSTNQNVKVSYADLLAALGGGGIGGSGTTNYVSKWTGANSLGNSQIFDNGANVGINTATPIANNNLTISQGATNKGIVITGPGTHYGTDTTGGSRISAYANIVNNRQLFFGRTDDGLGTNIQVTGRSSAAIYGQNSTTGAIIDTELGGFVGSNLNLVVKGTTGNVLIGTTGTDAGYKLDVSGTFRSTGDATINGVTAGRGNGNVSTNTSFGVLTFQGFNPTGNENSAFGFQAINLLTTGQRNTGIGLQALLSTSTGNRNTGLGYRAGLYISSGSDNTIIGNNNAINLTTGVHNTVLGSNTGHGIVTGSYNVVIGGNVTGLSSSLSNTIILADGQGNIRQYIDSTGNVGIGTATPSTKLQVNGTARFDLGASIYAQFDLSASRSILQLVQSGYSTTYYSDGRVSYSSGINAEFELSAGNFARFNRETRLATTAGNVLIGTNTDAGFKLDVNGTARVQGNTTFLTGSLTSSIGEISAAPGNTAFWMQTSSPSLSNYAIRKNAIGRTWVNCDTGQDINLSVADTPVVTIRATAGNLLDFASGQSTIRFSNQLWELQSFNRTGGSNLDFHITNNQGGINYSLFIDGNTNNVGLSTSTPNASALLDMTSTTKGFLPPRMTGTQAEAIASPAVGLMVFSTDGSGTTINSSGWWGYTSAGWVKIG